MKPKAIDVALLLIRIALGIVFVAHGSQKLFGFFGGPGLDAFASGLHMPAPKLMAILAGSAEFFGGLGVLFGLLTRIAAAGIAVVMLVAIFVVHLHQGFFAFEYPFSLLMSALALIVAGAGRLSLDWLIAHRKQT